MKLKRDSGGGLCFHGLTPLCADTLLRIPGWLASEDPAVRRRLLPAVSDDQETQAQWRRYAGTELEHLFLTRGEIVQKDLASLKRDGVLHWKLTIPAPHASAWLAALNGARLALFELEGLKAEDMDQHRRGGGDERKELALARIDLMAWMQELMLRAGR
jgi:hypothetical protein